MSEQKTYTMSEVKKHNTADSLWIVIHNKVYDVTAYKEEVRHMFSDIVKIFNLYF